MVSGSSSTTCSPASMASAPSRILSRDETLERLPTIKTEGLKGGVIYFDGQFDDSRLLINLVATACEQGATLLNYAEVTAVTKDGDGFVDGVRFRDAETGAEIGGARQGGDQRHRSVRRQPAAFGGPGGGADDRAQPGHPPGLRRIVPGGRQRHHGAAHQRRARHVRHPVARSHRGGHHRHADREVHAGTGRARSGGGVHPADGVALSGQEAGARRCAQRVRRHPPAGAFRRERATPRRSRATTPSASRIPA